MTAKYIASPGDVAYLLCPEAARLRRVHGEQAEELDAGFQRDTQERAQPFLRGQLRVGIMGFVLEI